MVDKRVVRSWEPRAGQLYYLDSSDKLFRVVKELGNFEYIIERGNTRIAVPVSRLRSRFDLPILAPYAGGGNVGGSGDSGDPGDGSGDDGGTNTSTNVTWSRPDATTTGLLTPRNELTVAATLPEYTLSTADTTYTDKMWEWTVSIKGAFGTRTFNNCLFTQSGPGGPDGALDLGYYGFQVPYEQSSGVPNAALDSVLIFNDCEFEHAASALVYGPGEYFFNRCYFHDSGGDFFKADGCKMTFTQCYGHNAANLWWNRKWQLGQLPGGTHADIVQVRYLEPGKYIRSIGCNWDFPDPIWDLETPPSGEGGWGARNAIYFFESADDTIGDNGGVKFFESDGDWLRGCEYTIRILNDGFDIAGNYSIKNSRFYYDYEYGLFSTNFTTSGAEFTDNIYVPTGENMDSWLSNVTGWPTGYH